MAGVAVRYSWRGEERVWHAALGDPDGVRVGAWSGLSAVAGLAATPEGPAAAEALRAAFAESVLGAAAVSHLRVVPAQPGQAACAVAPRAGQSLAALLERGCRQDGGIFQLRACFDRPSGPGYRLVRVALPRMFVPAQAPAAAAAGPAAPPVEEFDCAEGGLVGDLKAMLRQRTRLPAERMVLLLDGARLHDGLPLAHLAAAGPGTAALVLHLQLAAGGVHLLVRREGQGHREPRGPCRLTLRLPPGVRGARQRPLAVDPGQSFGDLCRDVQAASGLAPAGMLLELLAPSGGRQLLGARRTDHASTLAELGIRDGCEARVWHAAEELCPASPFDVGVDVAPAGQGQELYAEVARQLGVADAAGLALYAGGAALPREQGLSGLADGMVLSAFVSKRMTLSVSVFKQAGAARALGCWTSDTVAEVRQRLLAELRASCDAAAAALQGSMAFAVAREKWGSLSEHSLAGLADALDGAFVACPEGERLSQLGVADGQSDLVFVPLERLVVEVDVCVAGEPRGRQRLRVPSTARVADLGGLLERALRAAEPGRPPGAGPSPRRPAPVAALARQCARRAARAAPARGPAARCPPEADGAAPRPWAWTLAREADRGLLVGAAAAAGGALRGATCRTRCWWGGVGRPDEPAAKRQRLLGPPQAQQVGEGEFVGDLHAKYPAGCEEKPPEEFMCPIAHDIMQDPVLLSGSGFTYERSMIEEHFQRGRQTEPLTNEALRRPDQRLLIPNRVLRSQIRDFMESRVSLRLGAHRDI